MKEIIFVPKDVFSLDPFSGGKIKRLVITGDLQSGTLKKGMRALFGDKEVTVIGIEISKKGLSETLSWGEKAGVMVEPLTQGEYDAYIKPIKKTGSAPVIKFYTRADNE